MLRFALEGQGDGHGFSAFVQNASEGESDLGSVGPKASVNNRHSSVIISVLTDVMMKHGRRLMPYARRKRYSAHKFALLNQPLVQNALDGAKQTKNLSPSVFR